MSSLRTLFRNLHKFSPHQVPSGIPEYKPLPRTTSGDILLNYKNDRRLLEDGYQPKNAKFRLRFEVLNENDIDFMTQYITEHFVNNSSIVKSLGTKGDVYIESLAPLVEKWIKSECSVIFLDGDKLAGAFLGNIHEREEFDELYRGELFHENPKFVIKPNYAEDIKNGPFKDMNTNRIGVLLSELEWQTGKFLPKDCAKLGLTELTAVHPHYFRYYLALKSCMHVRALLQEKGCTHEVGYAVASGTAKLGQYVGWKVAFEMPYDKFLENGKPIFTNLYDNVPSAYTVYHDYKKDKHKVDLKNKI